jgi:hypothetical protein
MNEESRRVKDNEGKAAMQVIGTSKLAHRQNLGAKPANHHNPIRNLYVFLPLPAQLSETVSH